MTDAEPAAQNNAMPTTASGSKKRRLDETGFPDLGAEGIDADVAETLRKDSNGGL